jgi:hypothetical protein
VVSNASHFQARDQLLSQTFRAVELCGQALIVLHFLLRENRALKDMQQKCLRAQPVPDKRSVPALSARHMGFGATRFCTGFLWKNQPRYKQ